MHTTAHRTSPNGECQYVENLYYPASISSVSVYQNEENTLFIEFIANYDVDVEFFISKADYYTLDEEKDKFYI